MDLHWSCIIRCLCSACIVACLMAYPLPTAVKLTHGIVNYINVINSLSDISFETSSTSSTSGTSDSSHMATCGGETGAQWPLWQIYEYYNETHVSSNSRSSQTSSPSSHPPPPYTPRMGKSTLLSYLLSLTCYPSGLACCCDMTLSFGGKDWEYVDLCYLDPMCCWLQITE